MFCNIIIDVKIMFVFQVYKIFMYLIKINITGLRNITIWGMYGALLQNIECKNVYWVGYRMYKCILCRI